MAVFNIKQVKEINDLISEIAKALTPQSEIGAHDKASLSAVLKAQQVTKEITFFKCRREYTEAVITHFVKEKEVPKSRYHKVNQATIFVINGVDAGKSE